MDFKNFRDQLTQAPGMQGLGEIIAYVLIILMTVTVVMLCYRRFQFWGLLLAFGMVTVFAGYITILLTDSKNLPCTCIGLFENMTWKDNLSLNAGLIIIAVTGVITIKAGRSIKNNEKGARFSE